MTNNGDIYVAQVGKDSWSAAILRLDHITHSLTPLNKDDFTGDREVWDHSDGPRYVFSDQSRTGLYVLDAFRIFHLDLARHHTSLRAGKRRGFGGDGGKAVNAELDCPSSLAFDSKGTIYVADTLNNRIRKINSRTHIISTVAGNGRAGKSPYI